MKFWWSFDEVSLVVAQKKTQPQLSKQPVNTYLPEFQNDGCVSYPPTHTLVGYFSGLSDGLGRQSPR